MVLISILILLFIVIGFLNASEDKFMFHWHKSIFSNLDINWKIKFNKKFYFRHFFSQDSWRNKYNQRHYENGIRRIFTFKLHPAFTDWFHFSKSFRLILECIAMILVTLIEFKYIIPVIIGLYIVRNLSFSQSFNKLLNEK
jgi:hypothetical protein